MLLSVRLEATPHLEAPTPALNVLLVIQTADLLPLPTGERLSNERIDALVLSGIDPAARAVLGAGIDPVDSREAWTALAELWLKPSVEALVNEPLVGSLTIEVMNGKELDYERSVEAPALDVHYLSTRPEKV
jgi:hypothetical protein